MALDDMASVIAAVMALADNALVAFDLFPEGVLATSENETHADKLVVRWNRESVVCKSVSQSIVGPGMIANARQQCSTVQYGFQENDVGSLDSGITKRNERSNSHGKGSQPRVVG